MTANRVAELPKNQDDSLAIDWQDDPCPLCGEFNARPRIEAADASPNTDEPSLTFLVVRCQHCHLNYTNPRPAPDEMGRFYPADYKPHRRPRKLRQAKISSRWFGRKCPERKGVLPWTGPGRLLDFGCGSGSFLKRMADQGWDVVGLDAAVGAVRQVQEELGLTGLVGTLPHPDLQPGSFELVTMWHSIEHVHDPVGILREAYRLLVPGGKIVIACPNIESWAFERFGANWFGLDVPRHLTHFTPTTLGLALQTAGFRIETRRTIRHSDWLRSSAKRAATNDSTDTLAKMLSWKPLAKLAAWWVHLWGGSDCLLFVAQRPA